MFEIKIRYYIELLVPKTMKLLGIAKSKITKDREKVPNLENTKVVLVHCNIDNNNCQQKCCIHFFLINRFVNY